MYVMYVRLCAWVCKPAWWQSHRDERFLHPGGGCMPEEDLCVCVLCGVVPSGVI